MKNKLLLAQIENFLTVVAPHLPVRKLKGANHAPRCRLSALVPNNNQVPILEKLIPSTHKETVSIYRGKGYGGDVVFTTMEIADGLRRIIWAN